MHKIQCARVTARMLGAAGGKAPALSHDVGYKAPLQGPVVSHIMVSPGRVSRSLAYQPPDRGGISPYGGDRVG